MSNPQSYQFYLPQCFHVHVDVRVNSTEICQNVVEDIYVVNVVVGGGSRVLMHMQKNCMADCTILKNILLSQQTSNAKIIKHNQSVISKIIILMG